MINTIQEVEDKGTSVGETGIGVVEKLCDKELSMGEWVVGCVEYLRGSRLAHCSGMCNPVCCNWAFFNGLIRPMAR